MYHVKVLKPSSISLVLDKSRAWSIVTAGCYLSLSLVWRGSYWLLSQNLWTSLKWDGPRLLKRDQSEPSRPGSVSVRFFGQMHSQGPGCAEWTKVFIQLYVVK